MESEIDEIRREVNWKWWKNDKPINKEALQGEVIDMWHFLISLSLKCGLSAEDVYRIYLEKNRESHARRDGMSTKGGYEVGIDWANGKDWSGIPGQLEFDFEKGGVK
ncbi:dUTPase [Bacillus cereus]|uniref:dUTPase n=1 Tax=Bacillus cereus TaxID=1396 RepID=UPI001F442E32|nr:dUTPase [Bacillus cereus]